MISEDVANRLESEMIRVVKSGTGKRAALDNGYTVAGKTGSAEASNDKSIESHAWFVGYITNDNAPMPSACSWKTAERRRRGRASGAEDAAKSDSSGIIRIMKEVS